MTTKAKKNDLLGKKLLVLGGASQHCKIVETAKSMGIVTYVVDYLPTSPAKEIADFSYQINVTETGELVQLCKKEGIDGVLSGWLDFCQVPYQRLCEATGFPCYGTREQFEVLTNKSHFKKLCEESGVDTPASFLWRDWIGGPVRELPFPVFVKPSNSRGSRSVKVCRDTRELEEAICAAQKASFDGCAVVEKFINQAHPFLVVYFFVNGRPYLQQLSDAYFGDSDWGMEQINVAYWSPSRFADLYLQKAHDSFVKMLESLEVKNGPVCMQGFIDGDDVLFFDPGRRFPGGEYERAFKRVTGIDLVAAMIEFALTGQMPNVEIPEDSWRVGGHEVLRLQINVKDGVVGEVCGFDRLSSLDEVEYVALYHNPGDVIEKSGDVRQRFAQVVLVAENRDSMEDAVKKVCATVSVKNVDGTEMVVPVRFLKDERRGGYCDQRVDCNYLS